MRRAVSIMPLIIFVTPALAETLSITRSPCGKGGRHHLLDRLVCSIVGGGGTFSKTARNIAHGLGFQAKRR